MWIEPVIRFAFQAVAWLCWLVAGVSAFALWRFPQPESTRTGWFAIIFFMLAGAALFFMARRFIKFSQLPKVEDRPEPDKK